MAKKNIFLCKAIYWGQKSYQLCMDTQLFLSFASFIILSYFFILNFFVTWKGNNTNLATNKFKGGMFKKECFLRGCAYTGAALKKNNFNLSAWILWITNCVHSYYWLVERTVILQLVQSYLTPWRIESMNIQINENYPFYHLNSRHNSKRK